MKNRVAEEEKDRAQTVFIDDKVSKIIVRKAVKSLRLEDEGSVRSYRLIRSAVRGGLQMIGE